MNLIFLDSYVARKQYWQHVWVLACIHTFTSWARTCGIVRRHVRPMNNRIMTSKSRNINSRQKHKDFGRHSVLTGSDVAYRFITNQQWKCVNVTYIYRLDKLDATLQVSPVAIIMINKAILVRIHSYTLHGTHISDWW